MKVLVCDDEPDIQLMLELSLRSLGHDPITVGSADAALDAVRSERPDVLLLDVSMPGRDGPSLVRELRDQRLLEPPYTMLVSAITAPELREIAEELGVRWLAKPCTLDDISEAMDTLAA